MSKCIKNTRGLHSVDLSENSLCDEGLRHIAEALEDNSKIKMVVIMQDSSFTTLGIRHIVESLRKNIWISIFDLDFPHII